MNNYVGIVGSLLSALLVTKIGDFIWKFLPWGWGCTIYGLLCFKIC